MKVVDYYKFRGIKDKELIKDLETGFSYNKAFCVVDSYEYCIYYLAGLLDEDDFDIEEINRNVGTDTGNLVTIGMVEGDDILCINTDNKNISLKLIENGDGELVQISNSYKEFKKLLLDVRY